MMKKTWLVLAAGAVTCVALGCSDDEDSNAATNTTPDSGTSTQELSAYERLGGKEGVRSFVSTEVGKVLSDEQLKTYFFAQVASPIPAGHPSGAQIIECFSRLVASVVEAEEYPGPPVSDSSNASTPNFACRTDFAAMHSGLKIGSGTFDKFVGVIATDLTPLIETDPQKPLERGKISQAEFNALAAALTGTKSAIVDPTAPVGPAPFTP